MSATELLTAVLVLVTGYYAWQNQRMREMRRSRELSVRPQLALDFERLGGTAAAVVVSNVGQGTALDSDLTITFAPKNGSEPDVRHWQPAVLVPGASQRFFPPVQQLDMNALAATYASATVAGSTHDTLGGCHEVQVEVPTSPNAGRKHADCSETIPLKRRRRGSPNPLRRSRRS